MPAQKKKPKKLSIKPAPKKTAKKIKKAAHRPCAEVKPKKRQTPLKKKAVKALPASPSKPKLSFKKEMIALLNTFKAKVLQEVSRKIKSESDVGKFEIGDIYDIASVERERELSLLLGDRGRLKLAEIEDALNRIKDDTYGICEECNEPIAEQRLRALPFTHVCVDCKSRNELEERVHGRIEEEHGIGMLERSETEEEEF
ncbi:MAG: TraR/DksA family transcriptional regulator [Deltaproteobacteria bacterium]|nr:TraR/DksA family transcriptional regulator [Deltaproteobacteria bacterium]